MTFASLLINTCTVERFTEGAADGYGNPALTWADHLTDAACRASTPKNREVQVGAEVVLADLQLFLGDVDITEQDRVVLGGLTYEVLSAVDRQDGTADHHMECMLRAVKS